MIKDISNWNTKINFVLNCEVLQGFSYFNLNRLKNIFLKVISDINVWSEIEKMINMNFISLKTNKIHINQANMGLNSLSFLLFNLYMSELDFYIFFRCLIYSDVKD